MRRRLATLASAIALASGLGGCAGAGIEPWVQPYERGLLADEIMSFDRDPIAAAYRRHVFGVREAARGAEGGSGGGCGGGVSGGAASGFAEVGSGGPAADVDGVDVGGSAVGSGRSETA